MVDAADERDAVADARDAELDEREREVEEILLAAEERDEDAEVRDCAAYKRDMAADLAAYGGNVDDHDAYEARSLSATDRRHSRGDRVASKLDRHLLSDRSPNWAERQAETFGPVREVAAREGSSVAPPPDHV
jgi:hypothetical protein